MSFRGWIRERNLFNHRPRLLYGFVGLFFFSTISLFGQYFPETWANLGLGHSGRALAMGGAYVAVADDLAAVSYNPAGLAQFSRPEFSLSVAMGGQASETPAYSTPADILGSREYRIADKSFDLVGLAFPVKLGRREIAIGLTYRREFSFDASYSYSFEYSSVFGPPVPYGRNDYVADVDIDDRGGINIYTVSLATIILKGLYLGLNVNVWEGADARHWWGQTAGIRYENGVETLRSTETENDAEYKDFRTTISTDLGILWTSGVFSFGLVVRPKFRIPYSEDYRDENRITNTPGESYDYQRSGTYHLQAEWPWGVAIGASVRPTRSLTISCDFSTQKPSYDIAQNDNRSLRAGCEYRISANKLTIPLRAGGFIKWGQQESGSFHRRAYPGFALGAGLQTGDTAFDLVGFYHSWYMDNQVWLEEKIRTTISSWGVSLTLTFKLGAKN